MEVYKTGCKMCETNQSLRASTDGIVLETDETKTAKGLLKIKNCLQTNCHLIKDAVKFDYFVWKLYQTSCV